MLFGMFLLGLLASLPLHLLFLARAVKKLLLKHQMQLHLMQQKHLEELEAIKKQHIDESNDLIHRINHVGPLPIVCSTRGLIQILFMVIDNCLIELKKKSMAYGWDLESIIQALTQARNQELTMVGSLYKIFDDSVRKAVKDYTERQT